MLEYVWEDDFCEHGCVTFHESEPFYGEKIDLTVIFEGHEQSQVGEICQEVESSFKSYIMFLV